MNEENERSLDVAKEKKLKSLVLNHLKGGKTIAQAAKIAGVSTATFYKWSKSDGGFANKSSKLRESENEEELVDEKIIGGAIIRVGDQQIDASVIRTIKELKKTYNKNLYIKDF